MNTTQPVSNVPVARRLFITQYGALDAVLFETALRPGSP
jgi:hypothetical protein